eukprot:GHVN01037415.1.p1 GENE.GHVN01037415.1~~GHVN01037415.1.p1  ORF type:complete len:406 (+),score=36.35 GHVN01037415.1:740-1957(+)
MVASFLKEFEGKDEKTESAKRIDQRLSDRQRVEPPDDKARERRRDHCPTEKWQSRLQEMRTMANLSLWCSSTITFRPSNTVDEEQYVTVLPVRKVVAGNVPKSCDGLIKPVYTALCFTGSTEWWEAVNISTAERQFIVVPRTARGGAANLTELEETARNIQQLEDRISTAGSLRQWLLLPRQVVYGMVCVRKKDGEEPVFLPNTYPLVVNDWSRGRSLWDAACESGGLEETAAAYYIKVLCLIMERVLPTGVHLPLLPEEIILNGNTVRVVVSPGCGFIDMPPAEDDECRDILEKRAVASILTLARCMLAPNCIPSDGRWGKATNNLKRQPSLQTWQLVDLSSDARDFILSHTTVLSDLLSHPYLSAIGGNQPYWAEDDNPTHCVPGGVACDLLNFHPVIDIVDA